MSISSFSNRQSNQSDWDGEYSMMLHNIEDNIENIHQKKRSRISDTTTSSLITSTQQFDVNDESIHHHGPHEDASYDSKDSHSFIDLNASMNLSVVTSSSAIRYATQISELQLDNNELKNKLTSVTNEQTREKEKFIRQLQFLENENKLLKSELEARNEKYYLMKKKLQTTLRLVEQLQGTKQNNNSSSSSGSAISSLPSVPSKTTTISSSSTSNQNQNQYIHELESKILIKNNELHELTLKYSNLEDKFVQIEQQLILLQADYNSTQFTSHTLNSIQQQATNNEFKLKKSLKEIEKLELQLKNQQILEQELASSSQKIHQLKQSIKNLQEIESKYNSIVKEKESWTLYFHDVIKQLHSSSQELSAEIQSDSIFSGSILSTTPFPSSSLNSPLPSSSSSLNSPLPSSSSSSSMASMTSSSSSVSPIMILRYMSKLQNKCIELLHNDSQLELTNSELKSMLLTSEKLLNDEKQITAMSKQTIEQLNKRLTVLTQQSILYEGEVMSLRSLLKTYDMEFQVILGKNRQIMSSATATSTSSSSSSASSVNAKGSNDENKTINYETALQLKDVLVKDLRKELDESRIEFKKRLHELEASLQMRNMNNKDDKRDGKGREGEGEAGEEGEGGQSQKELIKQLQIKCEKYREEIFYLQSISRIDHLPNQTKILHLKRQFNPSYTRYDNEKNNNEDEEEKEKEGMELVGEEKSTRTGFNTPMEELKYLRQENKSLQNQLKLFQETFQSSSDQLTHSLIQSTGTTSSDTAPPVVEKSNHVDFNKLNIRLKEMFRERISSYREAVYLLLGYKVDLISTDAAGNGTQYPQLRLKSMYAENPDDSLIFQWKGEDNLELLETPYANHLDEHLLQTLRLNNSIPIFLANISLDLFEKQTYLGG